MGKLILYHGSAEIVQKPEFGKGKAYNDYGRGFYCTEHLELAKEWACTEGQDGYVNQYEIETDGLKILHLSSEKYTILHWLALLVNHRKMRISTPLMKRGAEWLTEHFLIDVQEFDVVVGFRADDSFFSFARAFLNNQISLEQLSYAMRLGKLGEQVVLISREAFERMRFVSYQAVDCIVYYACRKARDDEARAAYQAELEREDAEGIYMRDLLREEVRPDDARLR